MAVPSHLLRDADFAAHFQSEENCGKVVDDFSRSYFPSLA
jgi:hypothetical protein